MNETRFLSSDGGEKRQRGREETSGLKFRGCVKVLHVEIPCREERIVINRNFFSLSKRRDFEIGTRGEE